MPRPTVALLATYTLIHNTTLVKKKVGHAKSVTIVKASAYGHGTKDTALRLDQCVDLFGVASIDKAMQLRNANIRSPILLAQGICAATHHHYHGVLHHAHPIN